MMKKNILARNIILMDYLDIIASSCQRKKIDVIVLKGGAFFLSKIFKLDEREMTDVDILLKKKDEESFKEILKSKQFKEMPGSSQAYFKVIGKNAPPIIMDVHFKLRHIKEIETIWASKLISPLARNPNLFILSDEDVFLHLIAHALLHHGCFPDKTKRDLIAFLSRIKGNKNLESFLKAAAEKSRDYGLNPVAYYPLKEIFKSRPDLLSAEKNLLFKPAGMEKIAAVFFKRAIAGHYRFLEYLLPVLYRPSMALEYVFPTGEFIKRRYGEDNLLNGFLRPFRLLKNIIYGHG